MPASRIPNECALSAAAMAAMPPLLQPTKRPIVFSVPSRLPVLLISWDDLESAEVAELAEQRRGGHADEIETSINLYLQPERVHMERAVTDYRGEPASQIGYAPGKFDPAESGVFGDPTLATAEKGERVLAIMRGNLLEALEQFAER